MKTIFTLLFVALAFTSQAQTVFDFPMPSFIDMPNGDKFYSITISKNSQHDKIYRIYTKSGEETFCYSVHYNNFEPSSYQKCTATDSLGAPIQMIYHYSNDGIFYSSAENQTPDTAKKDMNEVIEWAMKFNAYIEEMTIRSTSTSN